MNAEKQWVATATFQGQIALWTLPDLAPIWKKSIDPLAATAIALSPDGTRIASGSSVRLVKDRDAHAVWLLGPSDGAMTRILRGHDWGVVGLRFTNSGKTLISAARDGKAIFWDVTTGAQKHRLAIPKGTGRIDVSEGTNLLAAGGYDGRIFLHDLRSRRFGRVLSGHTGEINDLRFSPKGDALAAAAERDLRIWDVFERKNRVHIAAAHEDAVLTTAWSGDGSILASGGMDGYARLWKASSGVLLREFKAADGAVTTVAFGADNNVLLTGGHDETLRAWRLRAH